MARVVKGLFVYGAGFAPVSVVLRFLHFAVSREPQPPGMVDRHFGCRRARCSACCVRFIQKERRFAGLDLNSVSAGRRSIRAEARGASFASLRRAGLRLALLKPVFSSVNCNYPSKSSGFYEFGLHSTLVDLRTNRTSFPSTYPCCRQLHIPVCRGVENNSKCTIQNSQLRSSSSF